jgi:hypothetical protein
MSYNRYWSDEALCNGMDVEKFFDKYEEDPELAKKIDSLCLACPVIKTCFQIGCSTESWGVWGGTYLVDGEIDKSRNSHKTKEVWKRILMEISDDN